MRVSNARLVGSRRRRKPAKRASTRSRFKRKRANNSSRPRDFAVKKLITDVTQP